MARRVDPLKAKQAKQKKIAAVGGVLLLGLLGVQGPKTLKMLQGPQPVASSSTTTSATTTPAPTAPTATTSDGTTVPAGVSDLASVADSDAAPEVAAGKLATFEQFTSKDPFVQQAQPVTETAAAVPAEPSGGEGAKAPAASPTGESGANGESGSDGGFTTGGSAKPAGPAPAAATIIAVNGVAEDVEVDAAFPEGEPTFVLVSVAENGKSVEIGIAGGEYAGGDATMTLALGEKLTLQNTADGSRYELELRSIEGFPLPKKG